MKGGFRALILIVLHLQCYFGLDYYAWTTDESLSQMNGILLKLYHCH